MGTKHINCEACGQHVDYPNGNWSCKAEITAMDSQICLLRNLLQLTVMMTVGIEELNDRNGLDAPPWESD